MPAEFIVGKIPDRTVIDLFRAISEKFGDQSHTYYMADLGFQDPPEGLREGKYVSFAISRASITTTHEKFVIELSRNYGGSPYLDCIKVSTLNNNNRPTPQQFLELEGVIRELVNFPDLSLSGKKDSQILGIVEKEVSSLASLHQKLVADALELRQKIDAEEVERRKALDLRQAEVEAALESKETESLERIAERQVELDEKLREFDFSDHMRARRQLREQITSQVREFLSRTPSTVQSAQKLIFVAMICLVGAAGSGALAFLSFQSFITLAQNSNAASFNAEKAKVAEPQSPTESSKQVTTPTAGQGPVTNSGSTGQAQITSGSSSLGVVDHTFLLWMLALRGLALSVVTVGFLAYLISFLRRSYDDEVNTLRELQRYGMDINRASWVIETAMEMTTKEGAQLPDRWVEGACAGLFQSANKGDKEVGSLAALGAVMGLGPEVSVGPDGATFRLPPKAAKKAANDGT